MVVDQTKLVGSNMIQQAQVIGQNQDTSGNMVRLGVGLYNSYMQWQGLTAIGSWFEVQ